MTGDDAGALADPLVRGVNPLAHVVVCDDDVRPVGADARMRAFSLTAALLSTGVLMPAPPPIQQRVRERGEILRGFDSNRLDAGHAALGEPASVPAGASSITPVTPRSTRVSMH